MVNTLLKDVSCDKDKQVCTVVGVSGNGPDTLLSAYISNDGGINWSSKTINRFHLRAGDISGIVCNSENNQYCAAVGSGTRAENPNAFAPIAYTTSNHGNSWALHHLPSFGVSGPLLRAISCNGDKNQYCTAVGDLFSKIKSETTFLSYSSTDGGENWTSNVIERYQGLAKITGISCINNNQACTVVGTLSGQKSKAVIYSSINGNAWSRYMPPEPDNVDSAFYNVSCSSNNYQCFAAGSSGGHPIIYKSNDGGGTWIKTFSYSDGIAFKSISCDDTGNYCVALGFGFGYNTYIYKYFPIIYRSQNGGTTWNHINAYTFLNHKSMPPQIDILQHVSIH